MKFWARQREKHGAVLIHVAIALVGLIAFSALAIDYGVLWASRNQVQNSADAGALAGATSLAYGSPPQNPANLGDPAYGVAKTIAAGVAQANAVWGTAPRVLPADVTIVDCPVPGLPDKCVRVNAFRNQDGGTGNAPLPTFFARLVGVSDQGVRATATAAIVSGNMVPKCIKPFALPDRWMEKGTTPSVFADTFDGAPDVYNSSATRWRFPADYGAAVVLHSDETARPTSSWAQLTTIGGNGTNQVRDAIKGCVEVSRSINPGYPSTISLKQGGSEGLKHAVDDLNRDAATNNTLWDHANNRPICGDGDNCDNNRFGAVPVYDPSTVTHPMGELSILDFVGIYIEGMGDDAHVEAGHPELLVKYPKKSDRAKFVVGHIVTTPGLRSGTTGDPRPSSFLRTVILVR